MQRNVEKTRRLLRHLARRTVRGYAVAALLAGGFVGAASMLEDSEAAAEVDDDGEGEVDRLKVAVRRATSEVLAADRLVAAAGDRGPAEVLVGTVSHCHGALDVLGVGP